MQIVTCHFKCLFLEKGDQMKMTPTYGNNCSNKEMKRKERYLILFIRLQSENF